MISVKESGYNGDNNLLAVKRVLILKNLIWRADKKMIQIVEHSAKHKKGGSFQAVIESKNWTIFDTFDKWYNWLWQFLYEIIFF